MTILLWEISVTAQNGEFKTFYFLRAQTAAEALTFGVQQLRPQPPDVAAEAGTQATVSVKLLGPLS